MLVAGDIYDRSMPPAEAVRLLNQTVNRFAALDVPLILISGQPGATLCDNGPENISQTLIDWANSQKITMMYIQPGKPTQNAYIERFNRTVRHEWLALHLFEAI